MAVLTITQGKMGAGKSYRRCADFLVNDWLDSTGEGVHWSNYPINMEALAELAGRVHGIEREEVYRRVKVFPKEVLKRWRDDSLCEGPWSFFSDGSEGGGDDDYDKPSLMNAHIAIDEAHVFLPQGDQDALKRRKRWKEFLAEARHDNCTVELLSQDVENIDTKVVRLAALRLTITNREDERDPWFKIPMSDWYELKGKWTGEWSPCIIESEKRKGETSGGSQWMVTRTYRCWLSEKYYAVYNSYSARQSVGGGDGARGSYRFERLGWFSLLRWFWRRHRLGISSRVLLAVMLFWFFFGGGGPMVFGYFMDRIGDIGKGGDVVVGGVAEAAVGLGDGKVKGKSGVQKGENKGVLMPGSEVPGVGDVGIVDDEVVAKEVVIDEVMTILPDAVVFEIGGYVNVGESIWFGPFKGRTLVEVLYSRRRVVLDDGTVVRMRRGRGKRRAFVAVGKGFGGGSAVSGSVEVGRGSSGSSGGTGGGGGGLVDHVSGGNALGRVYTDSVREGGVIGDLGGGIRRGVGFYGGGGAGGGRGSSVGGSEVGSSVRR